MKPFQSAAILVSLSFALAAYGDSIEEMLIESIIDGILESLSQIPVGCDPGDARLD